MAIFQQTPNGEDARYELNVPDRDPIAIGKVLQQHGIAYSTMVRSGNYTRVVVLDVGFMLGEQIEALGVHHGAKVKTQIGRAAFIGDDDRTVAQSVFRDRALAYESKFPLRRRGRLIDPDRRWLTVVRFSQAEKLAAILTGHLGLRSSSLPRRARPAPGWRLPQLAQVHLEQLPAS